MTVLQVVISLVFNTIVLDNTNLFAPPYTPGEIVFSIIIDYTQSPPVALSPKLLGMAVESLGAQTRVAVDGIVNISTFGLGLDPITTYYADGKVLVVDPTKPQIGHTIDENRFLIRII